jgi:2-iminobutanoate/2-iminopropanoate deaminase
VRNGGIIPGSVEDQTRHTLSHIGKILQSAGADFCDVVKCTCYLADLAEFDRFNAVYAEVFSGVRPARTTVQAVLAEGMKIEIDAIARLKD